MNKNIETEFKILVTKEQFNFLSELYPDKKTFVQTNTYYDNEAKDIQNHKGAMRIREKNNKFIFTLKMHSNEGLLEFECETDKNDASVFEDEKIKELLDKYNFYGPFYPTAKCTTTRSLFLTGKADLCFDYNQFQSKEDYEIEYEQTVDHDGKSEFNKILAAIGLEFKENCKSKIARALED